jgi:hypothetical protein
VDKKKNRKLPNALDEVRAEKIGNSNSVSTHPDTADENGTRGSDKASFYWRIFFRTGLATFFGFVLAGILAGFIEGAGVDYSLTFGSPLMAGLTLVLVMAFWVMFSFVGPYKRKQ